MSELTPDATKKKRRASYQKKNYTKPKILLVSTLDGKLQALDLRLSGRVLWTVVPPNHMSYLFPYFNLFRRGKPIKIIPSLNGDLYQFDGQCLQSKPIATAENLMRFKFFDDVEISGSREIETLLLKVSTGEFISTDLENEKKDLLEIIRVIYHVIVKGTSSQTEEHFQIAQYEISDSKAVSYHLRELELRFVVPAGKVHYKIKQNSKTYELDNPIVSAWQINGSSRATAINVFSSQQRELNSPVKYLTPSFYLGQFNQIVYIQNLLMDSSKQISISAKEISFDIAYPASGYNVMSSSFLVEKTICFDILLSITLAQETNVRSLTMPPSSDDHKTTDELLIYQRSISEPNKSSPVSTNLKSIFSSQFDIIGCLGYGGFGIVFEAMGKLDLKNYAVKRIPVPTKEKSQNRILREVKTLSKCEHLNIIRYYNAWYEEASADWEDPVIKKAIQGLPSYDDCTYSDSDKTRTSCSDFSRQTEKSSVKNENVKKFYLFIQMELCHSQSLKSYIQNNSVAQRSPYVKSILKQIADGVHFIHQQRLIHRDLKPGNIFFSLDRQIVKIGDFGLVTDIPNNSGNPTNASTSQDTQSKDVGTDLYMSPEQKAGQPYDSKVDIYSMGVIYVELLTNFDTEMERCNTLRNLRNAIIPRKFSRNMILKRMLTKNKDERPDMVEIQKLLNDDCRHGKKCNLPIRLMIDSPISTMGILLLSNVDQSQ